MARQLPMANMGSQPMPMGNQTAMGSVSPQGQFAMLNPQPKKGILQKGKEFLFGEQGQPQFLPTQTGPQQQLQYQALQNVLQMLQGGQNAPSNFDFGKIKAEAQNRFQTETLPSLAERFTSLGDSQGSSGYLSALGRSGADLDRGLGALEAQFGQQQQGQDRDYLLQLLRLALSPQFETQYKPATGGLFGNAAEGVAQGAGNFGSMAGGIAALKHFGFLL